VDTKRKKKLEAAGWKVGDTADFLELSPEEAEFVELKVALARGLREERERQGLTQQELADRVGSSQSRIAKMEAADPSVTVDLIVRSLFKLGARRSDVARLMRRRSKLKTTA
jgi:ribosome-binding protein aMBF1 (putative translation factor)